MDIRKFNFEWNGLDKHIKNLDISRYVGESEEFVEVSLPSFVSTYGRNEKILFPLKFVEPHQYSNIITNFKKCNWIGAAEYLASLKFEKNSLINNLFSISNQDINQEIYNLSLVNRYLLFLRDYAAYKTNKNNFIGSIGNGKIILSHDVDAIKVSCGLKMRQYFHTKKWPKLNRGENLNCIKEIVELEKKYGAKSIFFFNAGKKYFSIPLLDPNYKLKDLESIFSFIIKNNFTIGLHPGIISSFSLLALKSEIKNLKHFSKVSEIVTRNHWLSHFKQRTWNIQSKAGIKRDFSIGFNDRPGFRNSSSISYEPIKNLKTIPMIVMDGQFHNYIKADKDSIIDFLKPIVEEVKNVGGVASINFHQRFFHSFYGYKDLYIELLKYLNEEGVL